MQEIAGVLCDLDGTLIDSEPVHAEAWDILVRRHGGSPPEHWNDDCIGLPDEFAADKARRLFPEVRAVSDLLEAKQEVYRELVVSRGPALAFPGVREELALLQAAGMKLAVGTNSILVNTRTALEAAGLDRFFDVLVTLDQVERGKPEAEIYTTAAARLGVPAKSCAVLEDSKTGVRAGMAAGCVVLGVLNTWHEEMLKGADHFFPDTPAALAWALQRKAKN